MSKNKDEFKVSVLAFEKKLVPSDGRFYATTWQKRNELATPLEIKEKSVRGTVSHRLKNTSDKDLAKLNMDIASPNPQTVDTCALGSDQDTLKLSYTLKILSGIQHPSACNSEEFNQHYQQATNDYIQNIGFQELAHRYATNIANARFLWRNRVGAENIEVQVTVLNQNDNSQWTYNAKDIGLKNPTNNHPDILALAEKIADTLSGKQEFLLLNITAYVQIGLAQEVYPSEELVLDKGNSKNQKSKILYHIDSIAGMHSQKIGNALRTIDTWYPTPEDNEEHIGAIAIEIYGSVTNLGKAYRNPKDKADFYTLFDRFVRHDDNLTIEQQHYIMAVLVRGGVFGESSKD